MDDSSLALPEPDLQNARQLVSAGEVELALELVLDQLFERQSDVSPTQYESLARIAQELRVEPDKIESVLELIRAVDDQTPP